VTHMESLDYREIEVIAGPLPTNIIIDPTRPYELLAIDFLSELSRQLIKDSILRKHPDVMAFAYWSRKSNLNKIMLSQEGSVERIGRGLVFHIAPGNIPVNALFTLAFGILAGNSNIVRISNSASSYIERAFKIFENLSLQSKFIDIQLKNSIIKYNKGSLVSPILSQMANARMVWGGDTTIKYFKSLETSPRCVDVCFPDRYSLSILDACTVVALSESSFSRLVINFYNDTMLHDQGACSSPFLVLWQGDESVVSAAKERLWNALEQYKLQHEEHSIFKKIERFVHICRSAIKIPEARLNNGIAAEISRVDVPFRFEGLVSLKGSFGFFYEIIDNELLYFEKIVTERCQTVTYFGLDPIDIEKRVRKLSLLGVDRIVPVGAALDIGIIWDGIDIVRSLTRILEVR
jgi:hypothetical protein